MLQVVTETFDCDSLYARIETAEMKCSQLNLVVGRKIKGHEYESGLMDTARLVIDSDLKFRVYVYANVEEEGVLESA